MKNNIRVLVIKSDGKIVLRDNEIKLVTDKPYLSSADDCLTDVIDSEEIDNTFNNNEKNDSMDNVLSSLNKAFHSNRTNSIGLSDQKLKNMIEKLRMAKNIDDLDVIYNEVIGNFFIDSRKLIADLYDNYPELVLSVMAKTIIESYVKMQLNKTSRISIIDLEIRKVRNESLKEIVNEVLDIDLSKPSTNGVDFFLAKTVCDQLEQSYKKIASKCFDCANGYVSSCPKIADYPFEEKKDIEDYSFIKGGFQEYLNGVLDKFIVLDCDNYKCADIEPKIHSTAEERKIYQILREMFISYYDAGDIEEALSVQENNDRFGYK